MFFLAVFTLATLMTEPPQVVAVYKDVDACHVQASKNNFPGIGKPQGEEVVRWVCLALVAPL